MYKKNYRGYIEYLNDRLCLPRVTFLYKINAFADNEWPIISSTESILYHLLLVKRRLI